MILWLMIAITLLLMFKAMGRASMIGCACAWPVPEDIMGSWHSRDASGQILHFIVRWQHGPPHRRHLR
jgi:hypothetical protein